MDILISMKSDMKLMKDDMSLMKDDMKSMQGDIKFMQDDVSSIHSDLKKTNDKIDSVEAKTDKNTMLLEDLNIKVKTIAEVSSSFADQFDKEKDNDGKSLKDRISIIELAVTDTSCRVKGLQKDLSRAVRAAAENWAEIVELKAVK